MSKVKKEKKNGRPAEYSSKKPVSMTIQKKRPLKKTLVARDPRFSDFSGKLNIDLFSKGYAFLEDFRNTEKKELRKVVKGRSNTTDVSPIGEKPMSRQDAKIAIQRLFYPYFRQEAQDNHRRKIFEKSQQKRKFRTRKKKPTIFPV